MRWLESPGHHLIGWADADYPPLLRQIASPPLALFVDGEPGRLWHPQLAVVGSRAATAGGRDNARAFARVIAEAGFAITSGLADGIDAAAHAGALEAADGLTLAVVGAGPDRAYPVGHASCAMPSPNAAWWSASIRPARLRSGATSPPATGWSRD